MSDLKVENHKVVSFTYSILNEKGEVEEKNENPTQYVHGANENAFPAVMAEALEGAGVGETKEIQLPPEIGYGAYDDNKTYRARPEELPLEYHKLGVQAVFKDEVGKELMMTVMSVEKDEIFLDGNHPLAGKTLKLSMTVKEIRDATVEEIGSGQAEDFKTNESTGKVH